MIYPQIRHELLVCGYEYNKRCQLKQSARVIPCSKQNSHTKSMYKALETVHSTYFNVMKFYDYYAITIASIFLDMWYSKAGWNARHDATPMDSIKTHRTRSKLTGRCIRNYWDEQIISVPAQCANNQVFDFLKRLKIESVWNESQRNDLLSIYWPTADS